MDIEAAKQGEVVVLAPVGSLNTQTSPKLEQKAVEHLNASERKFVVDFSKVDYISSAGLRVLLMLAKRLKGQGALALCGLSDDVRKVFAICGFERDFTIARTRDEALEHVLSAAGGAPAAAPATHAPAAARPLPLRRRPRRHPRRSLPRFPLSPSRRRRRWRRASRPCLRTARASCRRTSWPAWPARSPASRPLRARGRDAAPPLVPGRA